MKLSTFLMTTGMVLAAAQAFADVTPPGQAECTGKQAGAACTLSSKAGVCVAKTCTKLDYSKLTDAGTPSSVEYACVLCEETDAGASVSDASTLPTTTRVDSGADVPAVDEKTGGCSLGGSPGARATTALLIAGALIFARRRRQAA